MPNKECPNCKLSIHVRTASCKCGHIFYTPVRKGKEVPPPPTKVIEVKKAVKDPLLVLKDEDEGLGYTFKEIKGTGTTLSSRCYIYKMIENKRYKACLSQAGKILGLILE